MPRAKFFGCAICKHSFTLHIPYCERTGCVCRGYVTKKEKILLHEHKFTLEALLHSKEQEVYKANKELEEKLKKEKKKPQLFFNPKAISPKQQYVLLTNKTTEWGSFLWYCTICKKKETYAKMLNHEHLEKIMKIKSKSQKPVLHKNKPSS